MACALGAALGACRKAPSATDSGAAREASGAIKVESAQAAAAGAAPARVEARTTEEWLARALELGANTDAAARKQALATLLAGMDDEARAVVLEALWAMGEGAGRAVFAELFTLWCEDNPQTAAKWAVTMWDELPGRDGESLREQAGFAWAKRDFDAAFAWSLGLRDVGSEWSLAAKILKEVALTDPRRALELARGVSDAFYVSALNRIFAGWVEHDPAAAFAELGAACKNSSMFGYRLGKWADRDPVATVRWAIAEQAEWVHSLAGYVEDKGALVAALYDAKLDWSEARYGQSLLPSFFNSWLRADQTRALVWFDALPDGAEKTALLAEGAKYRAWDHENKFIASAMPLILRLPEGPERDALLETRLVDWGRGDPLAALRWADEQGVAGSVREAAVVGAVSGLARQDPEAAQTYLATLPEGVTRAAAERELAAGWATNEAKAAAEWLNARQPDWLTASWGEDAYRQKYRIVAGWLDAESDVLFAWAANHADHAEADAILANAIAELSHPAPWGGGKPGRAIDLLLRLPADSETRKSHLGMIVSNWRQGPDIPVAEAFVRSHPGLTAEEKARLLGER